MYLNFANDATSAIFGNSPMTTECTVPQTLRIMETLTTKWRSKPCNPSIKVPDSDNSVRKVPSCNGNEAKSCRQQWLTDYITSSVNSVREGCWLTAVLIRNLVSRSFLCVYWQLNCLTCHIVCKQCLSNSHIGTVSEIGTVIIITFCNRVWHVWCYWKTKVSVQESKSKVFWFSFSL